MHDSSIFPTIRRLSPCNTVVDIPDNTSAAGAAIDASLRAGVERGLSWMYPTITCKHASGPHRGSCTYADLPSYWDVLISSVEKLNAKQPPGTNHS